MDNLSNYQNKGKLGEGGYGKVFKVLNKVDNKYYAMKIISNLKELKIDLKTLETINHENIVKYYYSFIQKDNSFEQEEKAYIIMEYCDNGDLRKFIENHKKSKKLINQNIILKILLDICNGLKEIHNKNMIHRDLKPENIFISHDYKIKIGDFGLCRQLNSLKSYASTQKGTWNYIAPEMFKENAHYNNKIDIWSLGCIIYELCTLKHCFDFEESGGYIGLSNKILNMEPDKINIKYYSSKLQDLIDSLLKKNYEKRPNINDIYKIILNYYKPEIDFSLYIKEIYFLINKNEKNNNNSYSIINDENNFCLEEVDYSSSSDNNDLEDDYPIGLHLGETSSCIGVFRNCGVEIIPNLNGERTTPSIITILDKNTILKGEETLPYIIKNYDSSIFGTKRFLGREYKDKDLIEEIKKENFPYKIVEDKKAKYPIIFIEKENKKIQFTLEEISSFIIRKMIDNAEAYLGKKVNNVVITVPTNFNDAQRNVQKRQLN